MDKISIGRKELVTIKSELKRTSDYWDHLLNRIEPCLNDEDWRLIKKISVSHHNCSQKIDQLLNCKPHQKLKSK